MGGGKITTKLTLQGLELLGANGTHPLRTATQHVLQRVLERI